MQRQILKSHRELLGNFASRFGALLAMTSLLLLSACGGGNRYEGVTPDELFEVAATEFEQENHGNAIGALDRLLVAHGDSF